MKLLEGLTGPFDGGEDVDDEGEEVRTLTS